MRLMYLRTQFICDLGIGVKCYLGRTHKFYLISVPPRHGLAHRGHLISEFVQLQRHACLPNRFSYADYSPNQR